MTKRPRGSSTPRRSPSPSVARARSIACASARPRGRRGSPGSAPDSRPRSGFRSPRSVVTHVAPPARPPRAAGPRSRAWVEEDVQARAADRLEVDPRRHRLAVAAREVESRRRPPPGRRRGSPAPAGDGVYVSGVALPPNETLLHAVPVRRVVRGGDRDAARRPRPDVPRRARRGDRPVRQEHPESLRREACRRRRGELRREEPRVVDHDDRRGSPGSRFSRGEASSAPSASTTRRRRRERQVAGDAGPASRPCRSR